MRHISSDKGLHLIQAKRVVLFYRQLISTQSGIDNYLTGWRIDEHKEKLKHKEKLSQGWGLLYVEAFYISRILLSSSIISGIFLFQALGLS